MHRKSLIAEEIQLTIVCFHAVCFIPWRISYYNCWAVVITTKWRNVDDIFQWMLKGLASSVTEAHVSFQGIRVHMENNQDEWKAVFEDAEPQSAKFPAPWSKKLSQFQDLLVLRCIRPDKLVPAVQNFVQSTNILLCVLSLNECWMIESLIWSQVFYCSWNKLAFQFMRSYF